MEDVISRNVNLMVALASFKVGNDKYVTSIPNKLSRDRSLVVYFCVAVLSMCFCVSDFQSLECGIFRLVPSILPIGPFYL